MTAVDLKKLRRVGLWLAVGAVLVDRILWATVSNWREDQATNLWLAYSAFKDGLPVGLISSFGFPNPNGVPLVSWPLTLLPNLLAVSIVLGGVQALLAYAFCRLAFGKTPAFALVLLPIVASVQLCATAGELWSQWLLASFNLALLCVVLAWLKRPSPFWLPVVALLILLGPAIYLGGIVSSVSFGLVLIIAYWLWRTPRTGPRASTRAWVAAGAISIAVVLVVGFATWRPYFRAVHLSQISGVSKSTIGVRIHSALGVLLAFPHWFFNWMARDPAPPRLVIANDGITPASAISLMKIGADLRAVQTIVALICLVLALVQVVRDRQSRPPVGWAVPFLFLLLSFVVGPIVGGPAWHHGERQDQTVQFFPLALVFLFAAPFSVPLSGWPRLGLRGITLVTAIGFASADLAAGLLTIHAHQAYRGPPITEADVPLTQKMAVVAWIASDWKKESAGDRVPVSYAVTGLWGGTIARFGPKYASWYHEPYTVGRSFDYELARRFGLKNAFEGQPRRPTDKARYVVSYAFDPRPAAVAADPACTDTMFGRLRVSTCRR